MIDGEWLGQLIDERHLSSEALRRFGHSFAEHEARVLIIDRFLRGDVAVRVAGFLSREAAWKISHGLWDAHDVEPERWRAAAAEDRFYRYRTLAMEGAKILPTANFFTYLSVQKSMADPRFAAFFEAFAGMPFALSKLDVHGMGVGDYLLPHSDRGGRRRLAFVLYLSPEWTSEWCGALRIVHRSGGTTDVDPRFNRLVVFDVREHDRHFVEKIAAPADDRMRLSIGGWFDDRPQSAEPSPEASKDPAESTQS